MQMRKFMIFGLISVALLFFWDISHAQDKDFQTAVLQKLNELDGKINELSNRLNEMDKRYEVRFTALEAKLEAVNQRIDSVNQRIDDKFNLIVGLLSLVVAFLALPFVPKLFERFKAPPDSKEDILRLEKQIEQIKTQLAQLSQAIRPAP
jgi:DNA repair exonuclease SbcCD ATPase subunit